MSRSHGAAARCFAFATAVAAALGTAGLALADGPAALGPLGEGPAAHDGPLGDAGPPPARSLPRLRRGSSGLDVERAQFLVAQDPAEGDVPREGDFDARTEAAVRRFQHRHHLPATGTVDTRTWEALERLWPAPPAKDPDTAEVTPDATPDAAPATDAPAADVAPVASNDEGLSHWVTALLSPGSAGTAPDGGEGAGSSGPVADAAPRRARLRAARSAPSRPAPASPGPSTEPATSLSGKDQALLARLIESEAGVCSLENKIAVGAVVLNRARTGWDGGSVSGVILERNQFDGVKTRAFYTSPSADSVTAAARAAAGEDPSRGATYYYNPYISHPAWARTFAETARIGTNASDTHRFMKPR